MIPERQNYTTACMVSRCPAMNNDRPVFFRCGICGSISIVYGDCSLTEFKCGCNGTRQRLETPGSEEKDGIHALSYVFFGGAEHNAVQISVGDGNHPMTEEHRIQWIYLLTYEGGQLKYLDTSLKARTTFAMAGMDAYSYCNRHICHMGHKHCQFQCKRGWEIYAYCSLHVLSRLIL